MPRKKRSAKTIHYIQLRTHRQWPYESTYLSHLEVFHSKIKPIAYDIDRILNDKWIHIRRPQLINQLNETHQQKIINEFLHKTNLIDYKYFCLNNQFNETNQFIRESFIHSIEIIDYLLYLYQQIEDSQRQIYQYRLNIFKYEFEQERDALNRLFIDQELKELDNQINVLHAIEEDNILQQSIQFNIKKRQIEEQFFRDTTILHEHFNTEMTSLRSTINEIIRSNDQQINLISKHCYYLSEKTRKGKARIDQEIRSIDILKRKINETKNSIDDIDRKRDHLYDKLDQLKQCSEESKSSRQNPSQIIFRRLCVLIDNVQKDCLKKLSKAERLLLLINQCERLELEDEKLLLNTSKIDFNQMTNKIISQVYYLHDCRLEFDSSFDELSLFWKRYAHVQMDSFIRIEERNSRKHLQNILRKKLKILF